MAQAPFVTNSARTLIGQETTRSVVVSVEDIKRLAIAIGDLNPVYLDNEKASASRFRGIIAHPMQYFITVVPPTPESDLEVDGLPSGRNPPMQFTNHVFGGAEIEFFEPIRPGDTITAKSKIVSINERRSSKGEWIAVVERELTCTNQRGEAVAREKSVSIYS